MRQGQFPAPERLQLLLAAAARLGELAMGGFGGRSSLEAGVHVSSWEGGFALWECDLSYASGKNSPVRLPSMCRPRRLDGRPPRFDFRLANEGQSLRALQGAGGHIDAQLGEARARARIGQDLH